MPEGGCGSLAARSALASKMGIAVGSSVIDPDYTGEVKVILWNHGQADCLFKAADRIAQLIVERIADSEATEIDEVWTSERGRMGFASSDLNPTRSITAKDEGI